MTELLKRDLKPRYYTIFLMLMLSLIIFSKLGYNGIPNYDDAYYAEKAKEVLNTGNIWVMQFNGNPEFDNPPVHMWLLALSMKIFGINEYAVRFSSAFSTILLLYLMFVLGKMIFNEWAGVFSSFVMGTTFFITKYSLKGMMDITLSLFFVLSILFFIMGMERNKNYFLLSGLMIGFAVLTKSILGFFPLITIILFLLFKKRFDILFSTKFILMFFISISVASTWYIINYVQFKDAFVNEHFRWLLYARGVGNKPRSIENNLAYFKVIFGYGLPWLPIALYGSYVLIKENIKSKKKNYFIILPVIWFWVPILILSLAYEKRSWYIMPSFFASAIINGYLLTKWVKNYRKFAKIFINIYFIFMIILVILPIDINSRKSNELKKIVPIVKQIVPKDGVVLNFAQDYWGHVCSFLFYTDRPLSRKYVNPAIIMDKLKSTHILCYSHRIDFNKYFKNYLKDIKILGYFGDYVLFCSKKRWEKLNILFNIPKS